MTRLKMNLKNIREYPLLIIAILTVSVFIFIAPTNRADALSAPSQKGLTLSPLRSELNIAPGTSLDDTLTVTNSSKKLMIIDISAEEFSVINQQYDYAFTAESNTAKWVSFNSPEIKLVAGDSRKIVFTVAVPLSAEPGGRYISLFAGTDTSANDGGISSVQRIASLLYITVTGDVTRSGHLVSLTSPWAISGDSKWSMTVQNTGTTHFRSRYSVQIKDIFGGVVKTTSGEALILPGTIRLVDDGLPAPQIPGIYKADYTIGLGDTPAVVESRFILYLPVWVFIISTVTIGLITLWLVRTRLVKKRKR